MAEWPNDELDFPRRFLKTMLRLEDLKHHLMTIGLGDSRYYKELVAAVVRHGAETERDMCEALGLAVEGDES
jgi:hypothetical protein